MKKSVIISGVLILLICMAIPAYNYFFPSESKIVALNEVEKYLRSQDITENYINTAREKNDYSQLGPPAADKNGDSIITVLEFHNYLKKQGITSETNSTVGMEYSTTRKYVLGNSVIFSIGIVCATLIICTWLVTRKKNIKG
ncbi:hypothetical protein [Paenibacillus gansuensis]|uniref:EF-hand domain-containing protein n=1 Tax=Paenibacillus gansuensis TaxID=306542 RepID=A0ABW5PJM1_9BACL